MSNNVVFDIQIPQEINFNVRKNEEELHALARVIKRNKVGFLLLFVESNLVNLSIDQNNKLQKMLERSIKEVFIDSRESNILSILARFENNPTPISIIGLDELLPSDNPIPTLGQLNHNRGWFKKLNCPVIIWLPEYAIRLIAEHAPDFWAWRSGTYSFHGSYQHISEAYQNVSLSQKEMPFIEKGERSDTTHLSENRLRTMRNVLEEILFSVENKAEKAKLLSNLGDVSAELRNWKDAIAYYQKTLDAWQEIGEQSNLSILIEKIVKIQIDNNSLSAALEFAQKAIRPQIKSYIYQKIASNLVDKNDERASNIYLEALDIEEKIGDRPSMINSLMQLGALNLNSGNLEKSFEYLSKALIISRDLADRHAEQAALANLGHVLMEQGDMQNAKQYYEQALSINRELGDLTSEGLVISYLANLNGVMGDERKAIDSYERALSIFQKVGNTDREARTLANMGNAYSEIGDMRRAIDCFERAQAIFHKTDDRNTYGSVLGNLGITYAKLGDSRRAIGYFEQALEIFEEIGDKRRELTTLNNMGNEYSKLGNQEQALGYIKKQIAISQEIGDLNSLATAHFNLAVWHAQRDENENALSQAREALRYWDHVNNSRNIQLANQLISQLQNRDTVNSPQEAFEAFVRVGSEEEMLATVSKYNLLIDPRFISAIEKLIQEQIKPEDKATFNAKLTWLRKINQKNFIPQFISAVISATREKSPNTEQYFDTVTKMSVDPDLSPEYRTLGKVLQHIMVGDKNIDLSVLPPEQAELIKKMLA